MGTMFDRKPGIPIWFWGVLVATILIIISAQGRWQPGNPALAQVFAAQPPAAGQPPTISLPQLDLGNLPVDLQAAAGDLWRQLGLGQNVRPVVPSVRSARLQVEISELRRIDAGLQVLGKVTNISTYEVTVPISAFELKDNTGASYVAGGGGSARLGPGESTPLDLTVPLPEGRGLLLITNLPPDPIVEQVLLVKEGD
jgi:hypothetical protein